MTNEKLIEQQIEFYKQQIEFYKQQALMSVNNNNNNAVYGVATKPKLSDNEKKLVTLSKFWLNEKNQYTKVRDDLIVTIDDDKYEGVLFSKTYSNLKKGVASKTQEVATTRFYLGVFIKGYSWFATKWAIVDKGIRYKVPLLALPNISVKDTKGNLIEIHSE